MCGALSDPPHKGQVAGPFMWLNLLVCLSVCIVSVLYFSTCSCSLKVTFGHGPKCVTEQGALHKVAVYESRAVLHTLGVSCNFCQSL